MIYVLTHPNSKPLGSIGELFFNSLKDNDFKVEHIRKEKVNDFQYNKGDIVIIIGAGRFPSFNNEQRQKNVKYVLWNSEPIVMTDSQIMKPNAFYDRSYMLMKLLPFYDYYFDYDLNQAMFMQKNGFECSGHVPLGYHSSLDYTDKYAEDFQYDAIFLGRAQLVRGVNSRRHEIWGKLQTRCNVYPSKILWGEDKYKIFSKCRIGLNIHLEDLDCFETWRINEYLCNRKLVISETIDNPSPLVNGQHFIMISRPKFIGMVKWAIKDYGKFKHIADQGYNFLKREYRFNDITREMMKRITWSWGY